MQHVKCSVYLGGDYNHKVFLPDVTVAEVVVLRAIHGDDAVVEIQPTRMLRGDSHEAERERLRRTYNRRDKVVDRVFPGAKADLPVNLKDIGVSAKPGKEAEDELPEPAVAE